MRNASFTVGMSRPVPLSEGPSPVACLTAVPHPAENRASDPPEFGHGEKGDFRKVTVTLPPPVYGKLIQESARRKMAGERNQLISAMVREAISDYLKRVEAAPADDIPQPDSCV